MKDLRGVLWVVSHSMLKILPGVILLLLLMNTFFVSPVESVGSIVYVDGVSGNDSSGNGNLATPFRTVQKALQVACCGIKIIILAGDYPENITMNKQVTIEAQGGLVRIGTVPDTGFEITSLPATDTDGNYTLEWTCSGLCPSNYNIQEDSDTNFNSPTNYLYYETNIGQPQSYDFTNKPNGTYCYRIVGSGLMSVPACVDVLIQNKPSFTGTVNSDGTITLDWTYDWFCNGFASTSDGYELEESTESDTGFVKVYGTAFTSSSDHESPKSYTTSSKSPGTYYYRVRAYDNSCGGYTSYSNIVQAEVTTPSQTRQVKITNQVGSQRLNQVVQVKIIPVGSTYSSDDLLTDDLPTCWDLPGDAIDPGESSTFDITIGSNYWAFIGMGIWGNELEDEGLVCGNNFPFYKTRFFTEYIGGPLYWVWVEVFVEGHTSGVWEWTITGSYLDGNLSITPAGNQVIPFALTNSNPVVF